MAEIEIKGASIVAQNNYARLGFAVFQIFNPINLAIFVAIFLILFFNYEHKGFSSIPGESILDSDVKKFCMTLLWSTVFYVIAVFMVYYIGASVFAALTR
jgi:hypothetical protein